MRAAIIACQGAVDMAKAVLLSTTDPEIRNLALGIMQAWLQHHAYQEKPQ